MCIRDRYTQGKRLSHYINVVNETRPDLILIAGDFITGPPEYIPEIGRQAGKLKAPLGVYGCVGDHDQWAYRGDPVRSLNEVRAAVSGAGVPIIDDDEITINKGNSEIHITFATNTYTRKLNLQQAGALMDQTPDGGLKIFLVHQPDEEMMKLAAAKGYDLYLAGHTHGGQITLMFPFVQLTPTRLETKYIKGDFYFGDMLAVVTGGLGMSILPVRYNSQPEVTVIDVRKK
jgi:predicted MPP superfamily phosphohydrolase